MTRSGKIGIISVLTKIHFLSGCAAMPMHYPEIVLETTDGQVCFHRQLFAYAVEPQGCLPWS